MGRRIANPTIHHFVGRIKSYPFDDSIQKIEKIGKAMIDGLSLHIVKKVTKKFFPKGITLVYVLSESHIVLHTWPESGFTHVDLVTCSFKTKKEFAQILKRAVKVLKPKSIQIASVEF